MSVVEFSAHEFSQLASVGLMFCNGSDVLVDVKSADATVQRRMIDFLAGLVFKRGSLTKDGPKRYLLSHEAPRLVKYDPDRGR